MKNFLGKIHIHKDRKVIDTDEELVVNCAKDTLDEEVCNGKVVYTDNGDNSKWDRFVKALYGKDQK